MAKNCAKLIIFSAPSGSGKSTIIEYLEKEGIPFVFSVSATSRPLRGKEVDGVDYHFLSEEAFREKISNNEFLEYEEVYPGRFYGTLKSEVDNKLSQGKNVILDIDVIGALNVKKIYKDQALTLFIMPPSVEVLKERLIKRGTDDAETIAERVAKAKWEISYANKFDDIIVNDDLATACGRAKSLVKAFIEQ